MYLTVIYSSIQLPAMDAKISLHHNKRPKQPLQLQLPHIIFKSKDFIIN